LLFLGKFDIIYSKGTKFGVMNFRNELETYDFGKEVL